jgi:formylglycine-generating enzyme required for sulfatase activity
MMSEGVLVPDALPPGTRLGTYAIERLLGRGAMGSPLGALDMAGNVWQWCNDAQPSSPGNRMLRGGGWDCGEPFCRSSLPSWKSVTVQRTNVGFRACF